METFEALNAQIARDVKRREIDKALAKYRDTINNRASTRDEIKEACNDALRRMADMIDLQTDTINRLVTLGKYFAELVEDKTPRAKS